MDIFKAYFITTMNSKSPTCHLVWPQFEFWKNQCPSGVPLIWYLIKYHNGFHSFHGQAIRNYYYFHFSTMYKVKWHRKIDKYYGCLLIFWIYFSTTFYSCFRSFVLRVKNRCFLGTFICWWPGFDLKIARLFYNKIWKMETRNGTVLMVHHLDVVGRLVCPSDTQRNMSGGFGF